MGKFCQILTELSARQVSVVSFPDDNLSKCLFKYIISPPKTKSLDKNSDMFHVSAQNIDCVYSLEPPRRGGSNEYPELMFWAEIRKNMNTPVNPSFTI